MSFIFIRHNSKTISDAVKTKHRFEHWRQNVEHRRRLVCRYMFFGVHSLQTNLILVVVFAFNCVIQNDATSTGGSSLMSCV